MKTILMSLSLALALTSTARADIQGEKVLSQRTVTLKVDLNEKTVKLSRAGYSMPLVKILVPDLADVTLLNHRNESEGAPCLSTQEAQQPSQVLKNRPQVERVPFVITLSKSFALDQQSGVCYVTLVEHVEGRVRGILFTHDRTQDVAERIAEDCR